jgi:hypothetical protein
MTDHDPLDLSALAPDLRRWQSVVDGISAGIDAVLRARAERAHDPFGLIASWRRPLLAGAAAMVLLVTAAELALEAREGREAAVQRLAARSAAWATGEQAPSASEILRVLGEPGP